MKKEVVVKDDGRLIIYFSFDGKNNPKPGNPSASDALQVHAGDSETAKPSTHSRLT